MRSRRDPLTVPDGHGPARSARPSGPVELLSLITARPTEAAFADLAACAPLPA